MDKVNDVVIVQMDDGSNEYEVTVVAPGIALIKDGINLTVPYIIYDPTSDLEQSYAIDAFWATLSDLKTLHKSIGDIIICHEYITKSMRKKS